MEGWMDGWYDMIASANIIRTFSWETSLFYTLLRSKITRPKLSGLIWAGFIHQSNSVSEGPSSLPLQVKVIRDRVRGSSLCCFPLMDYLAVSWHDEAVGIRLSSPPHGNNYFPTHLSRSFLKKTQFNRRESKTYIHRLATQLAYLHQASIKSSLNRYLRAISWSFFMAPPPSLEARNSCGMRSPNDKTHNPEDTLKEFVNVHYVNITKNVRFNSNSFECNSYNKTAKSALFFNVSKKIFLSSVTLLVGTFQPNLKTSNSLLTNATLISGSMGSWKGKSLKSRGRLRSHYYMDKSQE